MPENQDPGTANDFELYLKSVSRNLKTINKSPSLLFHINFQLYKTINRNKLIYSKNYMKNAKIYKKKQSQGMGKSKN